MNQWKAAVIVVALSSGLTLAFVAILGYTLRGLPDEIRLPLLIVASVAGLLASLALVVAVFSIYDLANKSFALGLPDGSVRAIIALLLIVLFSATTVFLTVRLRGAEPGSPVVDFAKQLLTILGTLMTSVTSFYFGTRAVSDGARVLRDGGSDAGPAPNVPRETAPKGGENPSLGSQAGDLSDSELSDEPAEWQVGSQVSTARFRHLMDNSEDERSTAEPG